MFKENLKGLFPIALIVLLATRGAWASDPDDMPIRIPPSDAPVEFESLGQLPLETAGIVPAFESHWYELRLPAGGEATIRLTGDGDTDVDCILKDSEGRIVDSDFGLADRCELRVATLLSETYSLEIRNLGIVWNAYDLAAL